MRGLNRLTNRIGAGLMMAMAVLWPAIAVAQTAPPAPAIRRAAPVWLGYLVMFVLLLLVLVVSLMPSKRGHRD